MLAVFKVVCLNGLNRERRGEGEEAKSKGVSRKVCFGVDLWLLFLLLKC